MSKPTLIRVNIAGFYGEPATIFAAYDPGTDVLAIARVGKAYEPGPREGFLKITNQSRDQSYDALFGEDDFEEAVRAFWDLESLKLLTLKNDAQRCNPSTKLERDGVDDTGMKFRFHPDMTNQQVAVLAACLYANRQRSVSFMADFAAEMAMITI